MMATYVCEPVRDPDLWWHITVGKWILSHQTVPHLDYWNLFGAGKEWVAYSWMHEVAYALADLNFGIWGLLVLQLSLSLLFAFSLFYCFGKIANSWLIGAFLAVCTMAACMNFFGLRPQVFAWVLFVWILFLAERVQQNGLSTKRILGICLVMMLWANSHITTAFGIAILFFWQLDPANFKKSFLQGVKVAAIGFAATFLTPYFGKEWIVFLTKADHPFANIIVIEFQPANIYHAGANILVLMIFTLGVLLHYRPRGLEIAKLSLTLLFVIAGITILKFIPDAAIMVAFLIACYWGKHSESKAELGNLAMGFHKLELGFNKIGAVPVLCCVALTALCTAGNLVKLYKTPTEDFRRPVKAVDFIIEHNLPKPILNSFGDGGYLIYRFSDQHGEPSMLVPIDGRTNVNPKKVMKAFKETLLLSSAWHQYLDIVNPETILWGSDIGLTTLLRELPDWCQVYSDVDPKQPEFGFSVFVKRSYFEQHRDKLTAADCS